MNNLILATATVNNTNDIINSILIQNCCDIIQTIASVATAITTIIAAVYAYNQYKTQQKHLKIEKSAQLAEEYKEKIIPKISIITSSLGKMDEVNKIYDKVDKGKVNKFDRNELLNYLNREEINKMIALTSSNVKIKDEEIPLFEIINDVLNELEVFCINFNSGIADATIVYQSLHQTFFKCVRYLYVYISSRNDKPRDKYFTNLIWVYNDWMQIYHEQEMKDNENEKAIEEENIKHKKVINALRSQSSEIWPNKLKK